MMSSALPRHPLILWLKLSRWKFLQDKRILAIFCLFCVWISAERALLYLQTGSAIIEDYDWYSLEAAGKRTYPSVIPVDWTKDCRPKRNSSSSRWEEKKN